MGKALIAPGQNPGAYAVASFGRQGVAPGFTVDTEGNGTLSGNLTVVGSIAGGSGLGVPNQYGLAAQTWDPATVSNSFNRGSGVCVFCLVELPGGPIDRLGTWLTQGGSVSSGMNGLALYTLAGVLVDQTVDMTAQFAGATPTHIEGLLAAGVYNPAAAAPMYLANLCHFSAGDPKLAGNGTQNMPAINGRFPSIFLTGQTSFPATFDPTLATINSGSYYMTAR